MFYTHLTRILEPVIHDSWQSLATWGFKATKKEKKSPFELECQVSAYIFSVDESRINDNAQGSSIGSYTTQWLNEFYWSACGGSAEDWLDIKKKERGEQELPPMKIVYPTDGTVVKSVLGPGVSYPVSSDSNLFSNANDRAEERCSAENDSGMDRFSPGSSSMIRRVREEM